MQLKRQLSTAIGNFIVLQGHYSVLVLMLLYGVITANTEDDNIFIMLIKYFLKHNFLNRKELKNFVKSASKYLYVVDLTQ